MNSLWDFDSDMKKKFSTILETFKREIYKGACVRAHACIQLSRLKFPKRFQMAQLPVIYSFPKYSYRDFTKLCDQREPEGAERRRPLRRGVRTSEIGQLSQVLGTSGVRSGWS